MDLIKLRQWHAYTGVFIAPSVLFFSLTGDVQLFSLHEARGSYQPWPLIEELGMMHKDQVFETRHRNGPPGQLVPQAHADDHADEHGNVSVVRPPAPHGAEKQPKVTTYLLKWFFFIISLGLTFSTLVGLVLGLTHTRRKKVSWVLLIVGAVVPILLAAA